MISYDEIVKEHWTDFLEVLKEMLEIPSVKGEAQPNAPYGKYPKAALEKIVEFGEKAGFTTKIIDNAIAYVEWGKPAKDYIGILGHLDVVPAGSGWSYPPFSLTEKDGVLYGRGILDNKGPIMSCFYSLKVLKDLGYQPQKTIRIIFGSDEESGMSDVPHYLNQYNAPSFGFTPDCKYPVVYGERGVVGIKVKMPLTKEELASFSDFTGDLGGDHVSDHLQVSVKGKVIEATGKRSPSNAPELGENALTYLAEKLQTADLSENLQQFFAWITKHLHNQHFGEGLGIAFSDKDSGKLILTPTVFEKEKDGLSVKISIRYPVSYTKDDVVEGVKKALDPKMELFITRDFPSMKKNKDLPEVKELSEIYEKLTGNDGTPVTTTGATYARKMPNIMAFGPSFPGQKGIAHNADEYMDVKDLQKNMAIYMASIVSLTKGTFLKEEM